MWQQKGRRYLLILAGTIALLLGVIGVVIPVLPTTPFILLAAFCYLRSSRRLYQWLTGHPVLGPYILNYLTYRAVAKKAKIVAMLILWASLLISIVVVDNLHVRLFLLVVGLAVSIHLVTLKTLVKIQHKKPDLPQDDQQKNRVKGITAGSAADSSANKSPNSHE